MKISRYIDMENMVLEADAGCIFAVSGPDIYQSTRLQKLMTEKFGNELKYDIIRFDGGELQEGDLRRYILENSLFAPGKLLIISRCHNIGKAAQSELMLSIDEGLKDCALFLVSLKTPRESAVLRKLEKKRIPFYICYEPYEREIPGWTTRLASLENIKLSRETVQLLAEYSGRNLGRMSDAIVKLALYHGPGSTIDRNGMLEVLSGKDKADIFHLGDMIFGNRRGKAIDAAWSLLRYGEDPGGLISFIFGQWQKVVQVMEIVESGGGKKEVANETGARFPLLDRLMKYSRSACRVDPAVAAEAFAEADRAIKTGVDQLVLLARLIFTLTSGHS
ncbi:MAG: DNA polymerase III subunit delta [Candidatus Aegiribacteria sp.]|nr:DNA polymerase III subunit delta [Candidatus Aegiribacteria sp.]